jgi:DNA-binding NarL/FixJ family response regulator
MQLLIVDDHPLFRMVLRQIATATVATPPGITECSDFAAACAILGNTSFDLVLLDLLIPGVSSMEDVFHLVSLCGSTPVAVISGVADPEVTAMVRLSGAAAFISKTLPPDEIVSAFRAVLGGDRVFADQVEPAHRGGDAVLTPMQNKVMMQLAKGKSNKEIANELGLSANTIKVHVTKILQKCGVATRAQAIAAIRRAPLEIVIDA